MKIGSHILQSVAGLGMHLPYGCAYSQGYQVYCGVVNSWIRLLRMFSRALHDRHRWKHPLLTSIIDSTYQQQSTVS